MLTASIQPPSSAQKDLLDSPKLPVNAFQRPHPEDQADLELMVSACRGSTDTLDRMPYVADHLEFLANREDLYTSRGKLPSPGNPVQRRSQLEEEYSHLSDDTSNNGSTPVFPYHTYWKGPMTWRIELLVKSFLQTQNVALSRLHIWVDENRADSPTAQAMLDHPLFRQFLPLVESQLIVVHSWKLPLKIPIRSDLDHRDGRDYFRKPWPRLGGGVTMVADSVFRDDTTGQLWLDFFVDPATQVSPVALSDVFRFVILHRYGGVYIDMDVLLMRDLRPLLTPNQPFAERWGCHDGQGDYNTAVLFLGDPGSSLATYFLRVGTRLLHNFHPRTMGDIARRDGRHKELHMLETAVFDPVWCDFSTKRKGKATVPDFSEFEEFFKARAKDEEWLSGRSETTTQATTSMTPGQRIATGFFKGAFGYHIHNLWTMTPEPGSWAWHITEWQTRYFRREEANIYGELWEGAPLEAYKF